MFDRVKVHIRIRPLSDDETQQNTLTPIELIDTNTNTLISIYTYIHVNAYSKEGL